LREKEGKMVDEAEEMLEELMPGQAGAKAHGLCPFCKEPVGKFRDEDSRREYGISDLCQKCQDETFGR